MDRENTFDKVWHAGLLKKLRSYGVAGPMLDLISSFLSDRKIKVTLDGQSSSDFYINAGVPQGSVLGPTLFLLFINDLPDHVTSQLAIYADDSTLYSCLDKTDDLFDMVELAANLEYDLRSTVEWGKKWLVSFNTSKTKLLSINRFSSPILPSVAMEGTSLPESGSFRLLGMTLSSDFSWKSYIESSAKSAAMKVGSLLRCKGFLTPETILYLYKSTIRPCIEYCCHLWAGAPATCLSLLDRIQQRICNVIGPNLSSKLDSLSHRRNVASLSLFYKYFHGHCSSELSSLVPRLRTFQRSTRLATSSHKLTVQLPTCHKSLYSNSFFPRTSALWNSLPNLCFPPSYDLQSFKCNVHRYLSSLQ